MHTHTRTQRHKTNGCVSHCLWVHVIPCGQLAYTKCRGTYHVYDVVMFDVSTSVLCALRTVVSGVFSPDCTLHTAITHVIKVLEQRSLM